MGNSTIPPHLLPDDAARSHTGELLIKQAKKCLITIAEGLRANAAKKEAQARALLTTVKSLYADDNTGFSQCWCKIQDFCIKEKNICLRNLDRHEASLRANILSPQPALKLRSPDPSSQPAPSTSAGGNNGPWIGNSRGRKCSRSRSSGNQDRRRGATPRPAR